MDDDSKKARHFALKMDSLELLIEESESDNEKIKSLLKQYAPSEDDTSLFLLLCEYYVTLQNIMVFLKVKVEIEKQKIDLHEKEKWVLLEEDEAAVLQTLNLLLAGYKYNLKNYNVILLTH